MAERGRISGEEFLSASTICRVRSLLSIGGGNAIIPQLQRETVPDHHWLTAAQSADSFAVAQVAPGPGTLSVTLLGRGGPRTSDRWRQEKGLAAVEWHEARHLPILARSRAAGTPIRQAA